jgi:hypothetical protein
MLRTPAPDLPVRIAPPSNLTLALIAKLPWSFDQSTTRRKTQRTAIHHHHTSRITRSALQNPHTRHSNTKPTRLPLNRLSCGKIYESELYIQHCISASPYQMSADGKLLALPIITKSILFPSTYRTANTTNNPPHYGSAATYTHGRSFSPSASHRKPSSYTRASAKPDCSTHSTGHSNYTLLSRINLSMGVDKRWAACALYYWNWRADTC